MPALSMSCWVSYTSCGSLEIGTLSTFRVSADATERGRDEGGEGTRTRNSLPPCGDNRLPYVRRPGLCTLSRIHQAEVQTVLPVRPNRLSLLLRLCGPELVPTVLLHDLLDHLHGLGESPGRRALQLEEQVVRDFVRTGGVAHGRDGADELRVDEFDAFCAMRRLFRVP
jgi:hypothetical protein